MTKTLIAWLGTIEAKFGNSSEKVGAIEKLRRETDLSLLECKRFVETNREKIFNGGAGYER